VSWRELAPEPARFWIRFAPKRWPTPENPYLDLADRRICWPGDETAVPLPEPPAHRLDLVYLPPVPRRRRAERERWIVDLERAGGAALVEVDPDEAAEPTATGTRILNLLPLMLGGEAAKLEPLPLDVAAVVPLLPGISAGEADWEPWLAALASAGRRPVLGIPVELTPSDRRRLADRTGEDRWEAIFHGDTPSDREFARAVGAAGLEPFPPRPRLFLPPRRVRNRELASALAQAGELWLRLGRSEADGQALLAAARHVEATPLDLAALAREGNLDVISWLSPRARDLVAEKVASGRYPLLDELKAAFLAPEVETPA
jgi:hypothetical protein